MGKSNMKNIKASKLILIFLFVVFWGLMIYSYFTLPDKVAIHFSSGGVPNGWAKRLIYVIFIGLLGTLTPLFVIWIFHITPNLPKRFINIPNKEDWLGPDQIQRTKSDLNVYGIWLAIILLLIFIFTEWQIINANKQSIVHTIPMYYIIVPLQLPIVWFIWKFIKRFTKNN